MREYLSRVCYDFFLAAFFVFMTSTFLDALFPGLVTRVFNIKYLIIFGALGFGGMIIFPPRPPVGGASLRPSYYIGVICVALWLTGVAYYMIPRTDVWRLLISLAVGVSVLLAGLSVSDPNLKPKT